MRILIAEDDPVSRRLLQVTLEKWGYDLVVCSDGTDALACLEGASAPEIAILDWMMPGLDGVEVCRRIRRETVPLPVYIMLLTAKSQREDIIAGLQAGADDIETVLDPSLPPAKCLPGEIHQVLLNIIVNAAHGIADKMSVTKKKGAIRITTSTIDGCVEIRVSDTGTGIKPEHCAKIFEPFFTTKDVGKGTGQGLALARAIVVQQHGGKIWFETELGKGTTFIIQLPIGGEDVVAGSSPRPSAERGLNQS